MTTSTKILAAVGLLIAIAIFARPQTGAALAAGDDEAQSALGTLKTGDSVTVYLRGDASGSVFNDRVPAAGNLISRSGKIVSADKSWVIIESKSAKTAFPRESIAMIEAGTEK